MNARDLETQLRDAYRAEAAHVDPGALIERVHAIPTTTGPLRPRWWHRLGFGAARSVGSGGIDVRGAQNMLTATRIAAVVAALALGSTFLALRVGAPDETAPAPAATSEEAWVTVIGSQSLNGLVGPEELVGRNTGMSDPRLEGDVRITFDQGMSEADRSGLNSTLWSVVTITNDGGTWHGPSVGFVDGSGVHHHFGWYEGTGDYDGLVFLEQLTEERASAGLHLDIVGLVYEGELPPTVLPVPTTD